VLLNRKMPKPFPSTKDSVWRIYWKCCRAKLKLTYLITDWCLNITIGAKLV